MCGFSGFWHVKPILNGSDVLSAMGAAIQHRGPDAQGTWFEKGLGLVHRRLSIQDLSPAGAQPMVSGSGRFVIAFNGEVYNFGMLRTQLISKGVTFRGHSDTEVMLAAFDTWGVVASLKKFAGMFAFVLLDKHDNSLYLCRDRMGEKPLYYGWHENTLLFGSELKALRAYPGGQFTINRQALPLLLRHNFIPAPHSIYKGIFKLPPATFIRFRLNAQGVDQLPVPERYWKLERSFKPGPFSDRDVASRHLEELLGNVIQDQMVSDVPLGAFLSGGIDSSTVVALMQQKSKRPVKTFSIGFDEPGFNEAVHARAVADHLKTEHTELYVKPEDALALVPTLPRMYDEPFADSSQMPTHLVSKMTREHVTVALSGDGGDELFCGYTRYMANAKAWDDRHSLRSLARKGLASLPNGVSANLVQKLVPGQNSRSVRAIGARLHRESVIGKSTSLSERYRQGISFWPDPSVVLHDAQEPEYALTAQLPEELGSDPLKVLMWRDLNWYLPDDILTKVDRAAMACSLETRIPMLDHRVVEFALGLPTELNVEQGIGKQVLRQVLYRHVPRELIDRPKQGFAVPVGAWLRTSLREWAEHLLDEKRLREQGFWRADVVQWYWAEHLSGREDYAFELWGILMFQAWYESVEREQGRVEAG